MFAIQGVEVLIGQETGVIVHHGGAGAAPVKAQPVDFGQRTPAPGVLAPLFSRQHPVETLRKGCAFLVADIIGIVERAIARVIVDSLPYRAVEQIPAAGSDDLAHQIPAAAIGNGRNAGHATALEDDLEVGDRVLDGQLEAVDRHAAALPLGVDIGFVVEFEVAHTGADQGIDLHQFLDAQAARVGAGAVDAHDRHDAFGQQQFAEIKRAIVVEDLDPLDAHALQFGQPVFPNAADTDCGGVADRPVHADAGVICWPRILVQFHGRWCPILNRISLGAL